MSYSRNFGIRSFENIVRDGRFRAPASSQLKIGEPVVLDPDRPGFLKQAGDGASPNQGAGVIVFEHIQPQGRDAALNTYSDFDFVPAGKYAQMVHGTGTKIWLKNTPQKTMYDGRVRDAAGLLASSVNVANLKPGTGLAPDGSGKFRTVSITSAQSEQQTITVSDNAKFKLAYGSEETTELDNSADGLTAASVQTALRALAGIGSTGVTVTGSNGGPFTVTFAGDLANTDVLPLSVVLTAGDSAVVTTSQEGADGKSGPVWLIVEQANPATGLVEARFTF